MGPIRHDLVANCSHFGAKIGLVEVGGQRLARGTNGVRDARVELGLTEPNLQPSCVCDHVNAVKSLNGLVCRVLEVDLGNSGHCLKDLTDRDVEEEFPEFSTLGILVGSVDKTSSTAKQSPGVASVELRRFRPTQREFGQPIKYMIGELVVAPIAKFVADAESRETWRQVFSMGLRDEKGIGRCESSQVSRSEMEGSR